MTKTDRRWMRRRGQWCIDHGLLLFGELFYAMAIADWEADQKWAQKRRDKVLASLR